MNRTTVSHTGIAESVNGEKVKVRITSVSACASCHAQGACSAADQQDKIIDAINKGRTIQPGDWVTVLAKESAGMRAVLLGYLLPFVFVLATLIVCHIMGLSEGISGLFALAVLVPYYFVLYLTRNRIQKSFLFEIQQ
ncbi:MAG: SoxR reducing system RseC family protein [Salinivirgaceae bacterium]|nr:SoxR reducing system RseC family protein [Salinivirgaceae bacterium]